MKKKIKILFIGNSLTYYNFLPECVRRMFEFDGVKAECVMLTASGKCLKYHSERPDTKYNILYGNYDYVVLQGVASGFQPDSFLEGGRRIFREFLSNTKSKAVLYNVWKLKNAPWKDQETLDRAYMTLASEFGAIVAPCGSVWKYARRIHGIPSLYAPDNNHPSKIGTYISAATIMYSISGRERAVRLSGDGIYKDYGLDLDAARKIHSIACRRAEAARRMLSEGYVPGEEEPDEPEV